MHGATHLVAGAVLGLVMVGMERPPVETAVLVGACVFGALLPDVDTPGSTLSRWFKPFKIFSLVGHRGIFHSWPVPLILFALYWRFEQQAEFWLAGIVWFVFWGYLSHLVLDMMNPSGIPLVWPLPRAARILPPSMCFKSGALRDWALMLVFAALFCFAFVSRYPSTFAMVQGWVLSLGLF